MYTNNNAPLGATELYPMEWSKFGWTSILQKTLRILPPCSVLVSNLFQHTRYHANPPFSVTGFSQSHDDGTGGVCCLLDSFTFYSYVTYITQVPSLSNFKIFPSTNCPSFETCPTSISARKTPRILRAGGWSYSSTSHRQDST